MADVKLVFPRYLQKIRKESFYFYPLFVGKSDSDNWIVNESASDLRIVRASAALDDSDVI